MARSSEASSEAVTSSETAASRRPQRTTGGELAQRGDQRATANPRRRTVARAALLTGQRWRRGVRWMGLAIFLIGAGLLGYVFLEALYGFQRFAQPDYLSSQLRRVQSKDWVEPIIAGVAAFGSELLRVLYLLLLGYLASVIAAKGIQFFSASDSIIDEAVASGLDGDMDIDAETG